MLVHHCCCPGLFGLCELTQAEDRVCIEVLEELYRKVCTSVGTLDESRSTGSGLQFWLLISKGGG